MKSCTPKMMEDDHVRGLPSVSKLEGVVGCSWSICGAPLYTDWSSFPVIEVALRIAQGFRKY